MARTPIDQALKGRHPVSRQAIWNAIRARSRAHGHSWFLSDLVKDTRIDKRTIRSYVDALRAGGFVEALFSIPPSYRLVRDVGHEAPRLKPDGSPVTAGASREQMWRTMKIVGQFTGADLAVQASVPESLVHEADAEDYCRRLARAGYLAVVSGGKAPAKGKSVYRFLPTRDTGPRAPMVQRLKTVFDPNTGKIAWQEEPRA